MRKLSKMLALASLLSLSAQAQQTPPLEIAYRIKNEAFHNSKVDSLAQFITDYLGPRLAASDMKVRAEHEVVNKLHSMGLDNARIEKASDFDKGGWDNKRNYVAMTSPYYSAFASTPKAWSGSTDGLVSGECIVVDINDPDELKKYSGQLKGKIILQPINGKYELSFRPQASRYTDEQLKSMEADTRPRQGGRRQAYDRKAVAKRQFTTDSILRAEGALAVIAGDGTFNIPGSRGVNYKIGNPEPLCQIALPIEAHNRMVRLINSGHKVEMEIDIKNQFTDRPVINNIIAEIPGTDPKLKNEVVLIGAHLDSWHGGTGGADDGSGCITMMEAMRILKDLNLKPRRTIRLALWGGEEQGLYGSRGYRDTKLIDPETDKELPGFKDFAIYLNMDYSAGRFRGIYNEENDMANPFFEAWSKPIASLGFGTISPRRVGSTDHVTFSDKGLPAFQFIQDGLDYFRTYHTLADTYERLVTSDLQVNACIAAWLAYCAAMDDNRIPLRK
ncbi:MAG: M20/M25/M40 family metallo-hydrolase [Muribaculaceae bacterium]|nr:M20/M25/M40 family metallo-hydrolase [Muribaculaceae bacterium]MDE5857294.1 M20/M25/M40 family metallo-hydrolase [Muribaculaceae bacterium]